MLCARFGAARMGVRMRAWAWAWAWVVLVLVAPCTAFFMQRTQEEEEPGMRHMLEALNRMSQVSALAFSLSHSLFLSHSLSFFLSPSIYLYIYFRCVASLQRYLLLSFTLSNCRLFFFFFFLIFSIFIFTFFPKSSPRLSESSHADTLLFLFDLPPLKVSKVDSQFSEVV